MSILTRGSPRYLRGLWGREFEIDHSYPVRTNIKSTVVNWNRGCVLVYSRVCRAETNRGPMAAPPAGAPENPETSGLCWGWW